MRTASFASTIAMSTALLAGALVAPAHAQTAAPQPVDEGAEIVVTGSIVASQTASIELKRNADNLVDIAAADSVGRFPDQNSAAALSRLPSIAVQRDQGQERYIQVRGAPNRWTSVSIDNIPVIGVDEGGVTRAYRFDAVPSVILSALAVNKSLTPDITAEAIVANIDLRTYSPFTDPGLKVQGDIGYGFMNLGKGPQQQGSLRISWSNDSFGIVAGASHYRRTQLTDNREVGLYDALGPTELDIRQYQILRENNGLFAGVEFRPSDGLKLFGKTIYTIFIDDERRNQFEFRLDRAASGTRSLAGGDLVRVPVRGTYNLGNYRTRNFINTLGGEYEGDDGFKAALNFNYTRTENTTYLPIVQASTAGNASPSLNFNFSNPNFPTVSLFQTVAGTTPGSVVRGPALTNLDLTTINSGGLLIPLTQDTFSNSYTVKFDASKEIGDFTLSAGLSYADRKIDGFTFNQSNAVVLSPAPAGLTAINPAAYFTTTPWVTGFPLGTTLNYVDNIGMRRDIDAYLTALQSRGLYNPDNVPPANRYALTERLFAGYAMAKWKFERGQVIFGVRVENFRLGNSGTGQVVVANTPPATGTRTVLLPLSFGQSYTDLFPSINAKFDLNKDLVLRVAGQRGIARPSFGEIRVGSGINDTTSPGTIGAGNPALKPEYTWGLDASLEYYLPGKGILSVAGFYRWVDNVLYANTQAVGSDAFDTPGTDRSAYQLTSTFNGQNGKLYGIEFNYQQQFTFLPSPFDGFGFQGNLTLLDGSFDTQLVGGVQRRGVGFPGTSKTITNASLYYEKYGISARISFQRRSDWLDTLGGLGIGTTGDEFRKGYSNVDVSLRYKINENFSVYADAANLTNAQYIAYEGTPAKPTEVEQIGSRYMFGVRFGF